MTSVLYVYGDELPGELPAGWRTAPEAGLEGALAATKLGVLVVAAGVRDAAAVVRAAHTAFPHAGVLVVAGRGGDQLRRGLSYAPGMPEHLQLLTAATELAAAVAAEQDQAHRRRRHAALLASVRAVGPVPAAGKGPPPSLAPIGTLLEHAPLGVLVVDTGGALVTWNDQAAGMLGLTAADTGTALAGLFADPQPVLATLEAATSSLQGTPAVAVESARHRGATLEVSAGSTRMDSGTPAVLVLLLDVTTRHAAEQARDELTRQLAVSQRAQGFLLQASDVLAHADSYLEALTSLAQVAVPMLGDLCLIDVIGDDGELKRIAVRHADPDRQAEAEQLLRHPPRRDSDHPIAQTARDRQARWSPAVGADFLRAASQDPEHFAVLSSLGCHGYLVVPLISGEQVLGTVALLATAPHRRFALSDLTLARELAGRLTAVIAKARRYDREHLVAIALQRAMQTELPAIEPLQLAARYVPARQDSEIGGDWYDAFTLPNGDTALVIGDVVGHDLGAATQMGQLRNLLRGLAYDRKEPPAAVLGRLHQLNDGLGVTEFATVVYGLLRRVDSTEQTFRWANAGHLPPVLALADGTARLLVDNPDVPIGAPLASPADSAVTLPPGSTLLLYTDGLVESRAHQLERGLPELVRRAAELASAPLEVFCDGVLGALADHTDDDIALLAVRVP